MNKYLKYIFNIHHILYNIIVNLLILTLYYEISRNKKCIILMINIINSNSLFLIKLGVSR